MLAEADVNRFRYHLAFCLSNTQILDSSSYMNSHEIRDRTSFKNTPPFFKQVIQGYIQCNVSHTFQDKNAAFNDLQMYIWGNRHIFIKMGDMLYFQNWIKSGLVQINDLR